ncbi:MULTISPECIES: cob(I)yrinic acid a,c-diamide adenosyltransferase [Prochlorococcus]|uniref:ATP:corrinoid adenosyltransferase n=1 Tax=Prochlorococcus marinus (strain SARG / CCMP1375 / SS120) TaxID=167539 RepID=Q7VDU3_PROMA|nr:MULTISPECIES: cob(I)yrinic acid a,c-diamide adenosyltransferase [Prochlorococcus]AAP99321.1 ATP:corrinoid adenosyltransferase [Prochlorococcus marinus subsp. marinus str. CCMP1375]KGG11407.1 Cob(I)alamin adenosyltransferase [Prochlorococcus marinus str. LG]KGG18637.1 Cob(I)alamin adenosyltransferase [Prochlorococcus marinus str. SS2]KGG22910.1 Cob(I)alamin adenosyltransferase [Prochlorococcus marinus str. SS35]KGG34014.1 Cob(I)alamin adenosyltransferase [Prochlorococcus marinus str. SS51]
MSASPSSTNDYSTREQYGIGPISSISSKPRLQIISSQGQLQVYASPYRGSFSAVLSEALRSAGLGSKVVIAQFLKGGVAQGPINSTSLCGNLEWIRPNIYGCIQKNPNSQADLSEESTKTKTAIEEIWKICKEHLINNSLDKLVLDEIGLAIEYGFLTETDLIHSLENRHDSIDVILTGPSIPTRVFSMADQVTQLRCSK